MTANGSGPLLRTEALTRHFKIGGALSRRTLHAVDDVGFTIGEREIVALAGESGSGKSTIARLLARIYSPTSGQIYFEGKPVSQLRSRADRLMVMYAGQVDEFGATRAVFDRPLHPYTQGLLEAFPSLRGPKVPLKGIPGNPPDLSRVPAGCRFRPRCPYAIDKCAEVAPDLYPLDGALVRCLRREDGSLAS